MLGQSTPGTPSGPITAELVEQRESLPPIVPPTVKGSPKTPSKRSYSLFAALEVAVYVVVAVLLGVAVWVNIWVAYFHGGTALVDRFSADANFLLAAAAILVIAFEVRKERKQPTER
jgi:hypothetical protein